MKRRSLRGGWSKRLQEGPLGEGHRYLTRDLWREDLGSLPTVRAFFTRLVRVLVLTVRGFMREDCLERSAALTYITVFSLVPMLAFAFAVGKGVGGFQEESVNALLEAQFGPKTNTVGTGADAREVDNPLRQGADRIVQMVESTDLKLLGTFGLLALIYSIIKMLGAAERALNAIWGVKRRRTLVRRFTDYLSIAVVVPIFLVVGSAILRTGRIRFLWTSDEISLSPLITPVTWVAPWFAMAFVLGTLTNTKVRFTSALLGGVIAGGLWQAVQALYFHSQGSLTSYSAIYSSFAAIPMLLLWIYFSWMSLLVGAQVAYAHQSEPDLTRMHRIGIIDGIYREALAPRLAVRIVRAFLAGKKPPTAAQLAAGLGITPRPVVDVLDDLVQGGALARTGDDEKEEGYLPARDPGDIRLADLRRALQHDPAADDAPVATDLDQELDGLLQELDGAARDSTANLSLRELAERSSEA